MMRLAYLLLAFCLLVSTCSPLVLAQDESSSAVSSLVPEAAASVPDPDPAVSPSTSETVSSENIVVIPPPPPHKNDDGKKIIFKKEIDVDAKDIIVNVGKVDIDIEIEKEKQHGHGLDLAGTDAAPAEAGDGGEAEDDASVSADGLLSGLVSPMDESGKSLSLVDHLKKIIIKKEIDVDAKDIIVNVGKVDIDIEIEKQEGHGHGLELAGPDDAPAEAEAEAGGEAEAGSSDSVSAAGLVSPMDGHGSLSLFDHLKKIIINKEIDVDAKDIIVNVGKVDIDIEIEKEKSHGHGHGLDVAGTDAAGAAAPDAGALDADAEALDKKVVVHHDDGKKIIIKKEIDVDAKDIILNVGKVDVDVEIEGGKGKLCKLFGKGC